MTIDALRTRIQPVLHQDFDAIREEFTAEAGTDDPRAFVRHLREWELIPVDLANSLLLELAVEEPQAGADGDEEPTLILDLDPDDDATEMTTPPVVPEPAPEPPAVPLAVPEPPPAPVVPAAIAAALPAVAPEARLDGGVADPASTEHDRATQSFPPATSALPVQPAQPEAEAEASPSEAPPSEVPAAEAAVPSEAAPGDGFDPEAETIHIDRKSLDPAAMRRAALARTPEVAARPASPPQDSAGRYDVLPQPAVEDSVAYTFLARDRLLKRDVAWRVPRGEGAIRHRFEREIRVWTRLDQPGVPVVHEDRGPEGCIVQRTEGITLLSLLAEARMAVAAGRPPSPEAELQSLLRKMVQLCEIVSRAHARGVVHRDLGPEQVILGPGGAVTVVGWGYAASVSGPDPLLPSEELEPLPRSPEQVRGEQLVDPRTDVYALGAILYEVWALKPPPSPAETSPQPAAMVPPPGRAAPEALRQLVRQALSPERTARPADAADLARALDQVLHPNAPAAMGPLEPVALVMARYPAAVLATFGLGVLFWLLTVLIAILW
jgi:tRNA A-37 threonylcarbamoyl transferase component Bud32